MFNLTWIHIDDTAHATHRTGDLLVRLDATERAWTVRVWPAEGSAWTESGSAAELDAAIDAAAECAESLVAEMAAEAADELIEREESRAANTF